MISVNIPTKKRKESLLRCIKSVPEYCSINIFATEEYDVCDYVRSLKNVFILYDKEKTVNECQNIMASKCQGHFIPCCDDIEFLNNSIDKALSVLMKMNGDGVVGFNQFNLSGASKTAIMLVGDIYYHNNGLFHNEYKHFYADTEFGNKAIKQGCFVFCEEAKIKHYQEHDQTYCFNRSEKIKFDENIYKARLQCGRA